MRFLLGGGGALGRVVGWWGLPAHRSSAACYAVSSHLFHVFMQNSMLQLTNGVHLFRIEQL